MSLQKNWLGSNQKNLRDGKAGNETWEVWVMSEDGLEMEYSCDYCMSHSAWNDKDVMEAFGLEKMNGLRIVWDGKKTIRVSRHDGWLVGEMIQYHGC